MKIPFILTLFLIVNLRAIRINHKPNHVYSYAGNTHYASQKPQHQDHIQYVPKHISDLTEKSPQHNQAFNKINYGSTHNPHKPSASKINFTYSNKPSNIYGSIPGSSASYGTMNTPIYGSFAKPSYGSITPTYGSISKPNYGSVTPTYGSFSNPIYGSFSNPSNPFAYGPKTPSNYGTIPGSNSYPQNQFAYGPMSAPSYGNLGYK